MTDKLFGITWAAWSYIYVLLPVLGICYALLVWRWFRQTRVIQCMVSDKHQEALLLYTSYTRRAVKALLYAVTITLLAIALLRPQWGKDDEGITQEGRDVVIALDISRSMLAQDVAPSRLSYAKETIRNIVHELKAERVALIIFAGDAAVQCPLTRDHNAFNLFLDGITPETITTGTTAIERALAKSIEVFQLRGAGNRQRLVVLLTDGEDFASNQSHMRHMLSEEAIRLFVMGVGTPEGAPIPEYDDNGNHTRYRRDKHGNVAISRCDTQLARALAQACNGVFVHASTYKEDARKVCQWVSYFEKVAAEEIQQHGYAEKYGYYVAPALAALCLEWLL